MNRLHSYIQEADKALDILHGHVESMKGLKALESIEKLLTYLKEEPIQLELTFPEPEPVTKNPNENFHDNLHSIFGIKRGMVHPV